MMKKNIPFAVVLLLCAVAAFGQDLTYARPATDGLDIELSQVHLVAEAFEEERIAYRFELAEGKKLSCIETQKTLRIRQMTPSQGTLYVFIPKQMLLENCSIRVNRADIRLDGVQAVHILAMLNMGAITGSDCVFKNAVINLARGTLSFNKTQIVRSCAFTVTDAAADIIFPAEETEYHIDYVQNGGSLAIAGNTLTGSPGEYGSAKAKRRIIFSGGAARASIHFTQKDTKTAAPQQNSEN
ncbi:hypothetical protein E4N71_01880 [Treponema vincentii]|uniref:Adhesin domain-containing protein n=2 Tax=Treponema vincentii TaxID=69710 RepID=S3LD99_9SPIR|nr:hypothetical protein [Treponema vincentii]EEV19890.1 hypothetical protein TREVI0001_0019 [Treponema vincentii ATCC 35580]EPF47685.1 hypothetical protein HMPREF1222_00588 [Treponema vincentii F0403]